MHAGISPLEFAVARALPAGVALLALGALLRRPLRLRHRDDAKSIALASVATAFFFGLTFVGAERLSASLSSLLGNCAPLFSVVLASLVGRERVSVRNVAGVALGGLGVALIALPAILSHASRDFAAIGAMLGGAFALAVNLLYAKRTAHLDPLVMNGYQFIGAGATLSLAAVLFNQLAPVAPSPVVLGAILYVSLAATAFAYVLWSFALRLLSVARASALLFLVPIFGHVWSWIFLRERTPGSRSRLSSRRHPRTSIAAGSAERSRT
ncbi:MAG: hypothetical protein NVS3B16_06040 [Vulcanimicrobiaceae bacterium]